MGGGQLPFEMPEIGLLNADKTHQLNLREIIIPFCERIEFDENDMPSRYFPLGKNRNVVVDPKRKFGRPTIKDTNILVETITDLIDAGESKETITYLYDISLETIEDAIEFGTAA